MSKVNIRDIKQLYHHLDQQKQAARLIRPEDQLGDWQQIVVIRHAQPDLKKKGRYTTALSQAHFAAYDAAPIVPFQQASFVLQADEVKRVFASTLIRSYATALALFGPDIEIVQKDLFREFEREAPKLFPKKAWPLIYRKILSRGQYALGLNSDQIESFAVARQRTHRAADFLIEEASKEGAAVLVAHGFFNYFLGRSLRKKSWVRVRRSGSGYLGVSVYVLPNQD